MHTDATQTLSSHGHEDNIRERGAMNLLISDNKGRSKPEIPRHLQNPVYTDVAERTSLSTPELL
jgi:hypothetical protein